MVALLTYQQSHRLQTEAFMPLLILQVSLSASIVLDRNPLKKLILRRTARYKESKLVFYKTYSLKNFDKI
jgi:hypothetical protein